jgi:hypothetical protein
MVKKIKQFLSSILTDVVISKSITNSAAMQDAYQQAFAKQPSGDWSIELLEISQCEFRDATLDKWELLQDAEDEAWHEGRKGWKK